MEFSELAETALVNAFGDGEKRDAWRASIKLHLLNPDILDKSIRLPRPLEKAVYLFPMGGGVRVTFDWTSSKITVWSITAPPNSSK